MPRPAPPATRTGALDGVRVLDLTAWWAGPSSTALLAALGADVVHIESARRMDGMRTAGGMFFGRDQWWDFSAFFLSANTNKSDVTLDLDTEQGRALLLRLVEQSDVVIENFTPRVLEAFGLDWDAVVGGKSAGRDGPDAGLRVDGSVAGPAGVRADDGADHRIGLADRACR